ncbi:hypothetical protein HDU76_006786, partial [Blyttiomyces sp. JEL0837]
WGGDVSGGDVLQCLLERLWVRDNGSGGGATGGNNNNGVNRNRIPNSTRVLKTLVRAGLKMDLGTWYRLLNRAVLLADVDAVRVILKAAGFERVRGGYGDLMVYDDQLDKMFVVAGKRGKAELIRLLMAYYGRDLGIQFTRCALMKGEYDALVLVLKVTRLRCKIDLRLLGEWILMVHHDSGFVFGDVKRGDSNNNNNYRTDTALIVDVLQRIGEMDVADHGILQWDQVICLLWKLRIISRLSFQETFDRCLIVGNSSSLYTMVKLGIIVEMKHLEILVSKFWRRSHPGVKLFVKLVERVQVGNGCLELDLVLKVLAELLVIDLTMGVNMERRKMKWLGVDVMDKISIRFTSTQDFIHKLPVLENGRVICFDLAPSEVSYVLIDALKYLEWSKETFHVNGGNNVWDVDFAFEKLQLSVKEKDKIAWYVKMGIREDVLEEIVIREVQVDSEKGQGGEGVQDESGTLEERKDDQNGEGQGGEGVKHESGTRDGQKDSENGDIRGKMDDTQTRGDEMDNENGDGSGEMDKNKAEGDGRDKDCGDMKEGSEKDGKRMNDDKGDGSGGMDETEADRDGRDTDRGDIKEENDSRGEQMNHVNGEACSRAMDQNEYDDRKEGSETSDQVNDENGECSCEMDKSKMDGDEKDKDSSETKNESRGEQVDDEKGDGGGSGVMDKNEGLGDKKEKVNGGIREGAETTEQINDEGEGGGQMDEVKARGQENEKDCVVKETSKTDDDEKDKDCEEWETKSETRGEQVDDENSAGSKGVEEEENEACGEFVNIGNGEAVVKEEGEMGSSEVVNDNKVSEGGWERECKEEQSETRAGDSVGVVRERRTMRKDRMGVVR